MPPTASAVTVTGGDGTAATLPVPFGPMAVGDREPVEACCEHLAGLGALGIVLVRGGAHSVGVCRDGVVLSSSTDRAYLQGRTAAGGWSQQRFARRRDNQRTASFDSAAATAARTARPDRRRLHGLVLGGDRRALAEVLADPRLELRSAGCPCRTFPDIAEPRRAVLDEVAARSLSVEITVRGHDRGTMGSGAIPRGLASTTMHSTNQASTNRHSTHQHSTPPAQHQQAGTSREISDRTDRPPRPADRRADRAGARPPWQVQAAVALLDGGATVPFIARYRKEATGSLDDTQLRTLTERLDYLRELEDRRAAVVESITAQGKLTDALAAQIAAADTKSRLEDIYLPFKPKRRTKAQIAREAGLEPLADLLIGDPTRDPASLPQRVSSPPSAVSRMPPRRWPVPARSWPSDSVRTPDLVGELRELLWQRGRLTSAVRSAAAIEGKDAAKFADYFDFSQPLKSLPSHRILAMYRGETQGVLTLTVDPEPQPRAIRRTPR